MKSSLWFRSVPTAACALALSMPVVLAQDPSTPKPVEQGGAATAPAFPPSTAPQQAALPVEVLEKWARELDSDNFDTRQDATRKLSNAGKQAIPVVTKAAEGDSLEATTRAVDVLKKLHQSTDKETKDSAQKALEGLSKSSNKSAARKAVAALTPEKPAGEDPNNPNGVIIQGIGGNIQIVPGARIARMQVQNNNGNKSIEVEEDGKKIKITEDKEGIAVTVTEKVDGKEKSSSYKAKDAEELKKNHPEGHKLWEKYAKNGNGAVIGNIQIQVGGGGGFLPVPIQARNLPARIARPEGMGKIGKIVKEAQQEIEEASRELRKQAENGKIDQESMQKAIGRIEAATKRISDAHKRFAEEDNADRAEKADGE